MSKTIVIADDHPLFLLGLRVAIENIGGFSVVGEATSVDELHTLLSSTQPDILITDFSMPGTKHSDGMRLIKSLRSLYPSLPVVVVTVLSNPGLIEMLYKSGVCKIINKKSIATELLKTLSMLGSLGQVKRPYAGYGRAGPVLMSSSDSGKGTLSPREYEVLRLMAEGMTITQIAAKQNRSKQTISSQKKSAMMKLGVKSDAEFFEYVLTNGL